MCLNYIKILSSMLDTLKAGTILPNTLLAQTLAYWPALSSINMAGNPTTSNITMYGIMKLAPEDKIVSEVQYRQIICKPPFSKQT